MQNNNIIWNELYIENCIRYAMSAAVAKRRKSEPGVIQTYENLISLINDPIKILVTGEFKTGKSTFINAILGRDLLKADVVPTTAVVTYLLYGMQEMITVEMKDGTLINFPITELEELTAEKSMKYHDRRIHFAKVNVYINAPILKDITIMDSPGINVTIQRHLDATNNVLEEADCIIWLMNALSAGKKTEITEIAKLPDRLKPFIVINRIDTLDPDRDDVDTALTRMGERIKPYCSGYVGISAYQALQSQLNNNPVLYKESRFADFINVLKNDYLLRKRELCRIRFFDKLAERKKKVSQVSIETSESKNKELDKWFYDNKSADKARELNYYVGERNRCEKLLVAGKNVNNYPEFIKALDGYIACMYMVIRECNYIEENKLVGAFHKRGVKQVKQYYLGQVMEIETFKNANERNIAYKLDAMFARDNMETIDRNYNMALEALGQIESRILDNKQSLIKLWDENVIIYNTNLGYMIEHDCLEELKEYGL